MLGQTLQQTLGHSRIDNRIDTRTYTRIDTETYIRIGTGTDTRTESRTYTSIDTRTDATTETTMHQTLVFQCLSVSGSVSVWTVPSLTQRLKTNAKEMGPKV